MKRRLAVVATVLLSQLLSAAYVSAAPQKSIGGEVLVDAIVASVDGKPITLEDLKAQVPGASIRSLSDASTDPAIREALDRLILTEVLEAESKARHIQVGDEEVGQYMGEVARRNSLTPAQLEKEITRTGRSVASYKAEIRAEILRTKILSQEISNSVQITDQEIDDYIKLHSPASSTGSTVTLRQFDNADGSGEGTLLSNLNTADLSPQIVDAITGLEVGELSKVVTTPGGDVRFKLESKNDDSEYLAKLRTEARDGLRQVKVAERASSFLQTDIYKKHTIDRIF